MVAERKHSGQLVFGLDIGTRSIVGTVGYLEGEKFHIIAQKVKEHETRSMLDGQIHDIAAVSETIKQVKEELEETLGRQLKEVCIAAAGRVLRTINVEVEQVFDEETNVTQEMIYSLDLLGVEKAYETLGQQNDTEEKFYCVGYTVVRYYLNKYPISNLENHKAKVIGAEIIGTFLPDEVVDGLYKAVEMAGLQVANLTLEPIAAIQIAIPQMYRTLNIALVDVGAGTSDISITRDGSIIAYGMIPSAGDKITLEIQQALLVDFAQAEKIKMAAGKKGPINYKDIMGLPQKTTNLDVLRITDGVVCDIAKQVADKMKELNGDKSVSAVFVVGGGGKIPGFTDALAKELSIAPERVALRGEEVMQNIVFDCQGGKKDSLFVTPIGICLNFYDQKNNFIFVNFNHERVKLYDNSHLLVVDAAMQAGFPNECLFPRRGPEINYTINGRPRVLRGYPGEASVITVNGVQADINTPIAAGDKIIVKESTIGETMVKTIGQLPEFGGCITVHVNEKSVELPKFAEVNGQLQSEYYEIADGDDIRILPYYTVSQIVEFMDIVLKDGMNFYVNNKHANPSTQVYDNFSVLCTMEELALSDVEADEAVRLSSYENLPDGDLEDVANAHASDEVLQNMNRITAEPKTEENDLTLAYAKQEGITLNEDGTLPEETESEEDVPKEKDIMVIANGKSIRLTGKKEYVFVDIIDHIDFDVTKPQGSSISTICNGEKVEFLSPIKSNDVLQIFWNPRV